MNDETLYVEWYRTLHGDRIHAGLFGKEATRRNLQRDTLCGMELTKVDPFGDPAHLPRCKRCLDAMARLKRQGVAFKDGAA